MKNLKRALSLVLSTAMLLGMMVVGTGAATHSDVKAEHNVEAIEVITAAGIMGANETFNPDAKITRNEMAVVMCNMLDLDTDAFAGACPYTEAAWAQSYVDAVYAKGIMSGDGVSFNGGANVTLVEAALMMMKALGYFQTAGDFEGGWDTATILKAAEIDLLDGVNAKSYEQLTRNQVAQLCLNALETPTVKVSNSANTTTSITAGDVKVEITGKNTYTENTNRITYNRGNDDDQNYEYLIEALYEDRFVKQAAHDDLDMPGTEWKDMDQKVDERQIIFVAKEADEVLISDGEFDCACDLYLDEIDDEAEFKVIGEDEEGNDVTVDAAISAGSEVYYFLDDNDVVEEIVVLDYTVAKVDEINTEDITKAEKADGVKAIITLIDAETEEETEVKDIDFAGFDYEEDDYVMVIMDGDEVLASYAADILEGKISAVKGEKVKVGGTYYKDLTATLENKDEIKVVLNKAEQVMFVIDQNAAVKSGDYAYIYNITENDSDKNEDGIDGDGTYTAYVVLADGSKAKYVIEEDSVASAEIGTVVAYAINSDDELEIKTAKKAIASAEIGEGEELSKDQKYIDVAVDTGDVDENDEPIYEIIEVYANSKTEFIFANWDDNKLVVTTETGIKNVNVEPTYDEENEEWIAANVNVVYDADDEIALYVFVETEKAAVDTDALYAVVTDAEAVITENEDGDVFVTYETNVGELTFKEADDPAFTEKGEVFAYEMDGDYAVLADVDWVESTISLIGEDFIKVAGTEYTYEDADKYTVTFEWNADDATELDELIVKSGASLKKDAEIKLVANDDDEIKVLFIIKNNY